MEVIVNGKAVQLSEQDGIEQVLLMHAIATTRGLAVAINDEVVPKTKWNDTKLKPNDRMTIIRATQGG